MLPDHVTHEITRRMQTGRLSKANERALARAVGLDLNAALSPPPVAEEAGLDLEPPSVDGPVLRGWVEFDINVECLDERRLLRCRTLYATSLADQNAVTSDPLRVIGSMVSRSEVLVWDDDEPAPHWQPFDERMLPPSAVMQIDHLIEMQAVAQGQSTS